MFFRDLSNDLERNLVTFETRIEFDVVSFRLLFAKVNRQFKRFAERGRRDSPIERSRSVRLCQRSLLHPPKLPFLFLRFHS